MTAPGASDTSSDQPRIVVVGDVMVDVLVSVRAPFAHASDTASSIETAPGGAASNQAVWMTRGGAQVSLVAAAGDDPFGEAALRTLVAEGVDVDGVVITDGPTGTLVALVEPDGQRSMLTDRGANLSLDEGAVTSAFRGAGAVWHVHVSGYTLLDDATRPAGRRALALASELAASRSVDASSAGPLAVLGAVAFLDAASGADVFLANLEEGRLLTGARSPDDVAATLASSFPEVVVTLGAEGAIVVDRDGATHRAPRGVAEVVDTVGAGDAFTGSYLVTRARGASIDEALAHASAAAASAVGERGARRWR